MIQYLEKAKTLIDNFKEFSIEQVPRSENKKADALNKITSTSFATLTKQVLVEVLKEKSIKEKEILAVVEEEGYSWMTPLLEYFTDGTLPAETKRAQAIKIKSRHYVIIDGVLSGYYWSTMHKDAQNIIRKCDDCQVHQPVPKNPQQKLTPITSPWPFYKWRIDFKTIPRCSRKGEVLDCGHRLLHQVDRSKVSCNNYRKPSQEIRLGQYSMQVWHAKGNHIRQQKAVQG
ncbi:reverse transcriptase domain-containing protein [Tanacetum coccineum]